MCLLVPGIKVCGSRSMVRVVCISKEVCPKLDKTRTRGRQAQGCVGLNPHSTPVFFPCAWLLLYPLPLLAMSLAPTENGAMLLLGCGPASDQTTAFLLPHCSPQDFQKHRIQRTSRQRQGVPCFALRSRPEKAPPKLSTLFSAHASSPLPCRESMPQRCMLCASIFQHRSDARPLHPRALPLAACRPPRPRHIRLSRPHLALAQPRDKDRGRGAITCGGRTGLWAISA
jgi:hypothetical protein